MSDKVCAMCDKPLSGCPCNHRKADDGEIVHDRCLDKYNYILKNKTNGK